MWKHYESRQATRHDLAQFRGKAAGGTDLEAEDAESGLKSADAAKGYQLIFVSYNGRLLV